MKKIAIIFSVFAVAVLVLTAGCGQKLPAGMPTLYPVTLTVTSGGQPVEGANVTVTLSGGTFNWPIAGTTEANGKVALMTNGQYVGAPEGDFVVCVRKVRYVEGPTKTTTEEPFEYGEKLEWLKKVQDEREEYLLGGQEYTDPAASPLKMTVKKGKNDIQIEMPEEEISLKKAS